MPDVNRSSFSSASLPLGCSSKGRESYNRFPFRQHLRSNFLLCGISVSKIAFSSFGADGALLEGRESYNRSEIRQPL
jgi:hypothetical protein